MAQNTKSAAQKPEDPTVPKKSSKKLIMIAGGIVAIVLAAGGGWYFAKGKNDAAHVEEVKVIPPKVPIFVALEPYTVNLKREEDDQYLQLGITLKVFEAEIEAKIKSSQPEIRSKILQLLTTKTASELLTAEGKTKLVREITALGNAVLGIVEAPAQVAIAYSPAQQPVVVVAASAVEAPHPDPAIAMQAAVVPAHLPAAHAPAEKKGIIDVLFTSFIIQ
jgi:flagellar protein FliL